MIFQLQGILQLQGSIIDYFYPPNVFTWTGLGTNSNWDTTNNWNLPPQIPNENDFLIFAGSTRLTNNNNIPNLTFIRPISGISFAAGAGAFNISGNNFTLGSGGISNNSSNTQQINNDIVLGTNAGTINCNTSNILLRGTISGSGSLTKLGESTLSLSGNNTYTGNTFISAGVISVLNDNPFGTGTVSIGNRSLTVSVNAFPSNTIINNRIFMDAGTITCNRSATFNGLITYGPTNTTNTITLANNATMTINGGISSLAGAGNLRTNGLGTCILSANPCINNNTAGFLNVGDSGTETFIIAVTGNRFQNISTGSYIRTDVPLAINDDSTIVSANNRSGRVDLNGNSQVFRNIRTSSTITDFRILSANNIFNNSSTFANLTANNTAASTYTGSISGNINLIKTGTATLNLSGSPALNVGLRYTGSTAISGTGPLINYALITNFNNNVNFAQFTNTTLTVNFRVAPLAAQTYRLLPANTINTYTGANLILQGAPGRTATYNSTNSTLTIA